MARERGEYSRQNMFSMSTVEVGEILGNFSGYRMTQFMVKAAQTAAFQLKKDVKAKFLEMLPIAGRQSEHGYSDILLDAVRQQNNEGAYSYSNMQYGRTFVHILGVKGKDSGTFRARMFNAGAWTFGRTGRTQKEKGDALIRRKFKDMHSGTHFWQNLPRLNFLKAAVEDWNMKVPVEKCLAAFIQGINHTKHMTQI